MMRNLQATPGELTKVSNDINEVGFSTFKGSKIVRSTNGWFMDIDGIVVANSIDELLFDINDLQRSIDFDNGEI